MFCRLQSRAKPRRASAYPNLSARGSLEKFSEPSTPPATPGPAMAITFPTTAPAARIALHPFLLCNELRRHHNSNLSQHLTCTWVASAIVIGNGFSNATLTFVSYIRPVLRTYRACFPPPDTHYLRTSLSYWHSSPRHFRPILGLMRFLSVVQHETELPAPSIAALALLFSTIPRAR